MNIMNSKSRERPNKTFIVFKPNIANKKEKKIKWDLANCCFNNINKIKVSSPKSDEEEIKEKEEKFESYWDNEFIEKDSSIKLKSKGGEFYIGIRVNNRKEKESAKILLTRSISDLTKFKLNYLDEEDKYELHFFEQLL